MSSSNRTRSSLRRVPLYLCGVGLLVLSCLAPRAAHAGDKDLMLWLGYGLGKQWLQTSVEGSHDEPGRRTVLNVPGNAQGTLWAPELGLGLWFWFRHQSNAVGPALRIAYGYAREQSLHLELPPLDNQTIRESLDHEFRVNSSHTLIQIGPQWSGFSGATLMRLLVGGGGVHTEVFPLNGNPEADAAAFAIALQLGGRIPITERFGLNITAECGLIRSQSDVTYCNAHLSVEAAIVRWPGSK